MVPIASVNGVDILFEIAGVGPRLLVFNGSGGTLAGARPLIAKLAEHFEVLVHDQRCLGGTTVTDAVPTMADYAADGAALLDHVGWPSARLFGISFGGMVAQEFAVTYPERVERLALVCTSPGGEFASYPLHQLEDLPPDEAIALGATLLDSRFTPEYLAEHPDAKAIVDMISGMQGAPAAGEVKRGESAQLDARSRLNVLDRLASITCPTLVQSGKYDMIAPPANGEAIAERIPNAELRLYEGGHIFFLQDPTAIPDSIEFLAAD